MLFFVRRGALACAEGVNHRLRIFLSLLPFLRASNPRQITSSSSGSLLRHPACQENTPKEPIRDILLKGTIDAPTKPGGCRLAPSRSPVGGSSPGPPGLSSAAPPHGSGAATGVSTRPRSLRPDGGNDSIFFYLYFIPQPPPPPRSPESGGGGGVGLCGRTGGMCETGWKKSSLGAHRIPAAPRCYVFFYFILFYLNAACLPRKKKKNRTKKTKTKTNQQTLLHNSVRRAPRFASGNG